MNRKTFLYQSGLLIAGSLVGCKASSGLLKTSNSFVPAFDLHIHPGAFFRKGEDAYAGDEAFLQRVSEMKEQGLNGAFFALVSDFPLLQITNKGIVPRRKFDADEGWREFMRQLNSLKVLLAASEAELSLKAKDLSNGKSVKAYLACEGGDFLGGSIERVDEAYREGVRSIQLVHYAPNALGDLQTWQEEHDGLSAFGKAVVKRMNKLGMVIDVAHASMKTVNDVVDISDVPILLSHSILKTGGDDPVGARAISETHAKLIASNGGLIGMWPSGLSTSLDNFVDNTLRMIDVVGIDHVGIGTDMDANYKPVISNYKQFNNWKMALGAKGLSESKVTQLAGGNAQRLLKAVL